jgi:hypothetical protein
MAVDTGQEAGRAVTRGLVPLDPALLRLGGVLSLAAVLAGLDATIVSVGIDSIASGWSRSLGRAHQGSNDSTGLGWACCPQGWLRGSSACPR